MSKNIKNHSDSNSKYDGGITISIAQGYPEIFFNIIQHDTGSNIYLTIHQMETMLYLAKEITKRIQETSIESIN